MWCTKEFSFYFVGFISFWQIRISKCDLSPIVTLPKYGQLQGSIGSTAWTNQTIFQFLGVPYAESPSGSRRFKVSYPVFTNVHRAAPVPIRPWKGVYNAQNFGRKCPTLDDLNKLTPNELKATDLEDCLNMAIYSASLNASRPVMVYVHGGSFVNNNADQYPPNYLMEREIILVVIQFRLSILGFMSTQSREIPGNAGLMDVVQSLKFVKENVEHFGGDPNRITIFGQSSGATMISALVISPAIPNDLFHRAIIQSGSIFANWAYSIDPITDARTLADAAGLNRNSSIAALNRAFMSMSVLNLLQAVYQADIESAMNGKLPIAGKSLSIGGPNKLLPNSPEKILQSKKYKKSIPLIIGTKRTDGSFAATVAYDYLTMTNQLNDKEFMTNDLINALYKFLDFHDDTGTLSALTSSTFWPNQELLTGDFSVCAPGIIDMLGTSIFKAPALKFAQMSARINPNATFLYTFDYAGDQTNFGYGADVSHYPFSGGVHHSDDLIYLFPHRSDGSKLSAADTKIAKMMVDVWTSFATDGVPKLDQIQNSVDDLSPVNWKPFNGPHGPYLHIDQQLNIGMDYRFEFTVGLKNSS